MARSPCGTPGATFHEPVMSNSAVKSMAVPSATPTRLYSSSVSTALPEITSEVVTELLTVPLFKLYDPAAFRPLRAKVGSVDGVDELSSVTRFTGQAGPANVAEGSEARTHPIDTRSHAAAGIQVPGMDRPPSLQSITGSA